MTDPNAEAKIACGCGENAIKTAPLPIDNPPGLDAIVRRVGTHGTFLAALLEDLSYRHRRAIPIKPSPIRSRPPLLTHFQGSPPANPPTPRSPSWTPGPRSLTSSRFTKNASPMRPTSALRPSASRSWSWRSWSAISPGPASRPACALAFDLVDSAALGLPDTTGQPTAGTKALIPAGTQAQSLPAPGEQPQIFETSVDLNARAEWNTLPVRKTRQQLLTVTTTDAQENKTPTINQNVSWIYLVGTATNLNAGSPLLLVLEDSNGSVLDSRFTRIKTVEPDTINNRTRVTVDPLLPAMLATSTLTTPRHRGPGAHTDSGPDGPTLIERLCASSGGVALASGKRPASSGIAPRARRRR